MEMKDLIKQANTTAREKGFWSDFYDALNLLDTQMETKKALKMKTALTNAFVAQKVALIMSECGEALEAMRKKNYGLEEKDTFEDEIADTFIRLADLCGELNIDIEKQINWKMQLNSTREIKHGKGF